MCRSVELVLQAVRFRPPHRNAGLPTNPTLRRNANWHAWAIADNYTAIVFDTTDSKLYAYVGGALESGNLLMTSMIPAAIRSWDAFSTFGVPGDPTTKTQHYCGFDGYPSTLPWFQTVITNEIVECFETQGDDGSRDPRSPSKPA